MSRVKKITIKPKKDQFEALKSQNVIDQFVRMVGIKQNKISIIMSYPKYLEYKKAITKILTVLKIMVDNIILEPYPDYKSNLLIFLSKVNLEKIFYFKTDIFSDMEIACGHADYSKLIPSDLDAFYKCYGELIESNLIKFIIVMYKYLIPHKEHIVNAQALSDKFLLSFGNMFKPLPNVDINFKEIYMNANKSGRELVLNILNKLFVNGNAVYELYTSPNYDMEDIVEFMTKNIEMIRKQIPRCDRAFDEILKSVHLLKNNYKTYFREYKQTENPLSMIESYIKDVYSKVEGDSVLAGQFQTIINYFRKKVTESGKMNDPKIAELFSHINMEDENFSEKDIPKDDDIIDINTEDYKN